MQIHLYCVANGPSTKLGITRNIAERMTALNYNKPNRGYPAVMVASWPIGGTRKAAMYIERVAHAAIERLTGATHKFEWHLISHYEVVPVIDALCLRAAGDFTELGQ